MCEKSIVNINSNESIVNINKFGMINWFISLRTLINLVSIILMFKHKIYEYYVPTYYLSLKMCNCISNYNYKIIHALFQYPHVTRWKHSVRMSSTYQHYYNII